MNQISDKRWFAFRLTILLSLLVLTVLGWRFVDALGGPSEILPELLRVHLDSEAKSAAATQARIDHAIEILMARERSVAAKVAAAETLADIALQRKKAYVSSGLSVSYGRLAADTRIANVDNSDLHRALLALERAVQHKNERLRLEAAYLLANVQLNERHAGLVDTLLRVLRDEYSLPIKTYLARAIGDIGPSSAAAAPELVKLLDEDNPRLLASAALALAKIGPAAYDRRAETRLVRLLEHTDSAVRASSAEALGAIAALHDNSERQLRASLSDRSPLVRVSSALALADLGLLDDNVQNALAEGFDLAPATTVLIEDVARTYRIQSRVSGYFAALGRVPESLVPRLVDMAIGSQDIEDQERLLAIIAKGDEFSARRADALLDLYRAPDFRLEYAVVDGLVAMGPAVVPHLENRLSHEREALWDLSQAVIRKLTPEPLHSAPLGDPGLMDRFESATDSFHRQELAIEMAESGDRELLDFLMQRRDERVLNGPVYDVVVNRLVANLRQYGMSPTHNEEAKRLALHSLNHLGVLSRPQLDEMLATAEDPELGNRVRDIWRAAKRARPAAPTLQEQLATLYGDAGKARNKDIQRIAPQLLFTEVSQRMRAVDELARISGHAIEAPAYLLRAMSDPSERVQLNALDAYVGHELTTDDSLETLEALFSGAHRSDRINEAAAVGLVQIGPAALDVLEKGASHESTNVRRAAAFGLWKLGKQALPARSSLETLANDPHRGVRAYAQRALNDLGGAP